jgi:hypothetical protein
MQISSLGDYMDEKRYNDLMRKLAILRAVANPANNASENERAIARELIKKYEAILKGEPGFEESIVDEVRISVMETRNGFITIKPKKQKMLYPGIFENRAVSIGKEWWEPQMAFMFIEKEFGIFLNTAEINLIKGKMS